MGPKRIVIVRHAEKPNKKSAPHLALRGKMRSLGLSKLLPRLIKPKFIFASTSTKNSNRPYATIRPTADKLGLDVSTKFADKQTKKIAKELHKKKYKGQVVLVCWHHGEIPKLIKQLGQKSPYTKWPVDLFDRILSIDAKGLSNLPQRLLFGDTED